MTTQIIFFQFKDFHIPFMTLQSIGLKFLTKIMRGSCVFCCSSYISFNPTSHFEVKNSFYLVKSKKNKLKKKPSIKIKDKYKTSYTKWLYVFHLCSFSILLFGIFIQHREIVEKINVFQLAYPCIVIHIIHIQCRLC